MWKFIQNSADTICTDSDVNEKTEHHSEKEEEEQEQEQEEEEEEEETEVEEAVCFSLAMAAQQSYHFNTYGHAVNKDEGEVRIAPTG